MKSCAQCGGAISRERNGRNWKRAKFCSHSCYSDSLKGKPNPTASVMIEAAARKRNGCANRGVGNADAWFWSKTRATDSGCVEWTGVKSHGYGVISRLWGRREEKAHRVAFFLTWGRWPTHCVLHSCDNRACVNPHHLRDGTHAENTKDAIERRRFAFGERCGRSKLKRNDVFFIRASPLPNKELAAMFGVHSSTISNITNRKTWAHD